MITRVLDANGVLIHDCEQLGCDVSWDGIVLAATLDVPASTMPDGTPVPATTLHAGDASPNAGGIPSAYRQVDERTVRLLSREEAMAQ